MKRLIKRILLISLSLVIIMPTQSVFAIDFFKVTNNIDFYDDKYTGCIDGSNSVYMSPDSIANQKQAAAFFSTKEFSGNDNQPLNAVQLAAIMGNLQHESGFNPNAINPNGLYKGLAQWNDGRWNNIEDPKTNLDHQLDLIKKELDGSYKDQLGEFWNSSSPDDIEKATYAIARNYEVAFNPGKDDSSTSWNNANEAAENIQNWSSRISDAKTMYNKYGNSADSSYTPGPECGELVSGGMTYDEAKKFMETYKYLTDSKWTSGTETEYDINGTTCKESSLANCVAFSQYFINRYTSNKISNPGDGMNVVSNLIAIGFDDGGTTPSVYSVFSTSKIGGEYGHTGVVLGIDKDNNKIVIGEAACGLGMAGIVAREEDLSKYSGGDYTFAYTDKYINSGSL